MVHSGQRISEYVLDQRVGGGAFGEVWRAHHHVWVDQYVAIKIPTDEQYLRALQREGVAVHELVHPNIVRAIGFDPYARPPYLVMEYIPGSSLRPLIRDRKLTVPQVVSIMRQVLAGLGHAHASGMVHRDVKPENILVHERALTDGFDAEGVIKVTDFGLGQAANRAATGSIVYSQSLHDPEAASIVGTLEYMPPEQRTGETVDARADVYACGVILYEMLTGERPAGTDCPSDLNPQVPKYLDEVFRRSYARLEKRYASAAEFAAALAAPRPTPPALPVAPPPMVMRPATPAARACPQCRHAVEVGDQFCMHCGVQLVARVRRCSRCGGYPDIDDRHCIHCGAVLEMYALA